MLERLERVLIGSARSLLAFLGIQPASVKALLKRPTIVHGGPKARRWPWPRRRHFDSREKQAALRVLRREIRFGNSVIYNGVEEKAYCEAFAAYMGGGFADAVNSGTNAIFVALKALDLEPGSEVVVSAATDPGGMMPVAMNLCVPIPVDSAPGSILVSADQIAAALTPRTSAILVAHLGGHPVDMDPILRLAAARRLPVVEDCAQAHGTLYRGRMVGTLGTISAFSTMFGKHHCTGAQGGVVFTKDPFLSAKAKRLADRGKPFGIPAMHGNMVASLNFNQDEISMAIGRVQLEKLPNAIKARRRFASSVEAGLRTVDGIDLIGDPPECESSYLFLMLRLDRNKLACTSTEFAASLEEEGIDDAHAAFPNYPADYPWYRRGLVFGTSGLPWSLSGSKPRSFDLPNVRAAQDSIVRVDIHEAMGQREVRDLLVAIRKSAEYFRTTRQEEHLQVREVLHA